MCGIVGKLNFHPDNPVEERLIKEMCSVITHRGPDDEGLYLNNNVGLGHRRLSIIDLHVGHQPIFNEDRSIVIVFNGEIYNYRELRDELLKKSHQFSTATDTEVIVHLYEEFGVECLQKLNGMFGFALWDNNERRLFVARDRIGIKPVYYYYNSEGFVFASELKAILKDNSINLKIDFNGIDSYLSYGYIPSPATIYKDTYKLLPGHYIIVKDKNVTTKKYWDIVYNYDYTRSKEDSVLQLQELLESAVKMHLVSDVPVGAFLSGGIDSSIVVALMSKIVARPVKTFSIGFEVDEFNETKDARMVADSFHTEHTELILKPDAVDLISKLAKLYDEPFADSSAIPTYIVSKLASQNVKVVLSGDGGDELFAGYTRYLDQDRDKRFLRLPDFIRGNILGLLGDILPPSFKGKNYFQYISKDPIERYIRRTLIFNEERKSLLYENDFKNEINSNSFMALNYLEKVKGCPPITQYLYLDSKMYLPEDILTKVDRASMAHSLEVRVPLLDYRLIEFAATIPPDQNINKLNQKIMLKEALSRVYPGYKFDKQKQGFGVPLERWFRHELKELCYDVLLSPSLFNRGYFKKKKLKALLDEHQTRDRDNSHLIWTLLCLELWHREFVD